MALSVTIDLETLSTNPDARILEIAAVVFDEHGEERSVVDTFSVIVDDKTQPNRSVNLDTVRFWHKPENVEKFKSLVNAPEHMKVQLKDALISLNEFLTKHNVKNVWACGPEFDCVILTHACKSQKVIFATKFWNWHHIRTIENLAFGHNTRRPGGRFCVGTKHDALDDCLSQAWMVQAAVQRIARAMERQELMESLSKSFPLKPSEEG